MSHPTFYTSSIEDDGLRIELIYPPAMYYALVHNGVPIVRQLRVENVTDLDITDVEVTMTLAGPDGPVAAPWVRRVLVVSAQSEIKWDDFGDFTADLSTLKQADEAFPVSYRVTASYGPNSNSPHLVAPSRVLAHNEWLNSPVLYESVAAFVQPNTDSVHRVLRRAGALLQRETGSSSLQGYQAGPKRAALIGAAVYEALREHKITYVALPPSFEGTGQKVRTTAAVLRDRLGNCIDLSVTYAACLEAAGLRPLVWIIEGHAFAGFFVNEDRLPASVSLAAAQMINVVESDKAVAVELTGIGPGTNSVDFAAATRLGRAHLRGPQILCGMVDIHLAHRSGIRPLPSSDIPASHASDLTDTTARPAGRFSLPDELEAGGAFDQEDNLEVRAAHDDAPPRVAAWRRALLDLSLRNPLLKLPKRGKGLDLHVPAGSLADLDDLVHSGKAINVVAQDTVGGVQELRGVRRAQDLPDDAIAEELSKDRRIYAAVTQASYVHRMRGLQRDARTLQQETGSNYLYLTLGSLVHPTPTGEAHAPLFLLPVRIEGGAGRRPYTILIDGDEVAAPNYCLVQWLRVKHGAQIAQLQDPITDEHGIDIVASFRSIKKALVEHNLSYRVDESASLRLLQFSTFQMWRDLTGNWENFQQNAVVRHLVENSGKPMVQRSEEQDVDFDEGALHLPIAADGSQMRAIAMAEQGRSFVLEGPPGTGKSQTIANLIAHSIRSGKKVLFVAEKQAALDVVKRRLASVGLEDFCLDLHGRKQTARSIRQQLKSALEHQSTDDPHGWKGLQANYRARLATLRRYPGQLHSENGAGFSAWSAYQALIAHGEGPSATVPAEFFSLPEEQHTAAENASRELTVAARSAQLRPHHPWRISGRREVTDVPADALLRTAHELEDLRKHFGQLADPLRTRIAALPGPTDLAAGLEAARLAAAGLLPDQLRTSAAARAGWDQAVTAAYQQVSAFQQQHAQVLSVFRGDLFILPEFDDLSAQAAASTKGLFGKKKRRSQLADALRGYLVSDQRLDESTALPTFHAIAAARHAASLVADTIRTVPGLELGDGWWPTQPGAAESIQSAHQTLVTSRELRNRLPALWEAFSALGSRLSATLLERFVEVWTRWLHLLGTTEAEFAQWSAELGWAGSWERDGALWNGEVAANGLRPLQRWAAVLSRTDALMRFGLTDYSRQILEGEMEPEDIELAFLRGVARSALNERLRTGDLEYFDADSHEQEVGDYVRLGKEIRARLPEWLSSEIIARRTQGRHGAPAQAGELIRRLNSRRDRLSFRDAIAEYPGTVTALTPCFLMSPASVANFLEPGAITFDIVVFDEASQIRVAQAIGAMGRARSVVVVGDSKQMPPTSIMEATHAEETESPAVPEDLDSILAECVESGLSRESLTWHYRSTDESLIAFSNAHYYDGQLASLPSPGGDPTSGIFWRRVDGEFDRGTTASRTNSIEARAVVAEISSLLADPRTTERSIGVVTFNIQQRDLVLNLLEESADERIQTALARQDGESLFVKNLENVQGDERDVILFSLAFSKHPDTGQLPLNFGPLSLQGGERRLNVAVTEPVPR